MGNIIVACFLLTHGVEVIERGQLLPPTPAKPLIQFGHHFKYITISTQAADVQNLV